VQNKDTRKAGYLRGRASKNWLTTLVFYPLALGKFVPH
jgi:hypothetical protein